MAQTKFTIGKWILEWQRRTEGQYRYVSDDNRYGLRYKAGEIGWVVIRLTDGVQIGSACTLKGAASVVYNWGVSPC